MADSHKVHGRRGQDDMSISLQTPLYVVILFPHYMINKLKLIIM
jgi:hypothetical protein